MKPRQQLDFADTLRAYREQLEKIVDALGERGQPLSAVEAGLLLKVADTLTPVEGALREDAERRKSWLTAHARIVLWARPRIGNLHHYEAKRLRLPAKYLEAQPPNPAPTISIVTPSFQHGRFLERTLYSVVNQRYPALEYVVQDGGSSDGSVDVLRRFEKDLILWKSEPDGGQADAINRGFRETTGDIMGWLNSDDLLLPGSLAYVARYFAEHPDVDVVYGNRLLIDENDGQIGEWILPPHDDLTLTLADFVPQETLFWRRGIWEAAGGCVDDTFAFAVDWDLLLRFREAGAKMVRLPRLLGAFRVHEEQKTTAEDATGVIECDLIRRRLYGRTVLAREIRDQAKPYLVRHLLAHLRHRLKDRLTLRRFVVQTFPTDKGVQRPIKYDGLLPVTRPAQVVPSPAGSAVGSPPPSTHSRQGSLTGSISGRSARE